MLVMAHSSPPPIQLCPSLADSASSGGNQYSYFCSTFITRFTLCLLVKYQWQCCHSTVLKGLTSRKYCLKFAIHISRTYKYVLPICVLPSSHSLYFLSVSECYITAGNLYHVNHWNNWIFSVWKLTCLNNNMVNLIVMVLSWEFILWQKIIILSYDWNNWNN